MGFLGWHKEHMNRKTTNICSHRSEILKEKTNPIRKNMIPGSWLREGEKSLVNRLKVAFDDLNCINRL